MAACDAETLNADAKCFVCESNKQLLAIQVVQLANIAGVPADPNTLIASAKAFMVESVSEKQLLAIQAYLLCQIANA